MMNPKEYAELLEYINAKCKNKVIRATSNYDPLTNEIWAVTLTVPTENYFIKINNNEKYNQETRLIIFIYKECDTYIIRKFLDVL